LKRKLFRLYFGYQQIGTTFYVAYSVHQLLGLITIAFGLLFNIYLKKLGYEDPDIAYLTSMRFLGVLLLALPAGLLMRFASLKYFMVFAAIGAPLFSLGLVESVAYPHLKWLSWTLNIGWGMSMVFSQVAILPYILRTTPPAHQTEAIAFAYTSASVSQLIAGSLVAFFAFSYDWGELSLLRLFSIIGFSAIVLTIWLEKDIPPPIAAPSSNEVEKATPSVNPSSSRTKKWFVGYDWKLIAEALWPEWLIMIGAGMTIPFMSLIFYSLYGCSSGVFGLIETAGAISIIGLTLILPVLKKRYGYPVVISGFQIIANLGLVLLGLLGYWSSYHWIFYAAIALYVFRQPFLFTAIPMTRQLTMQYVGTQNREMISALISSLRSGSYFVSGLLFGWLRALEVSMPSLLLIGALIYGGGIVLYIRLIRRSSKLEKEGV
jgi:MFS family permease